MEIEYRTRIAILGAVAENINANSPVYVSAKPAPTGDAIEITVEIWIEDEKHSRSRAVQIEDCTAREFFGTRLPAITSELVMAIAETVPVDARLTTRPTS